jgi:hypothetical protein
MAKPIWDPDRRVFRVKVRRTPEADQGRRYDDLAHLRPEHRRAIEANRLRLLRERGLLD